MSIMENSKKKKSRKWQRITLIVISVILALILIFMAGAAIYVNHLLDKITYENSASESQLSSSEVDEIENSELQTIHPSDGTLPTIDDSTFPSTSPNTPPEEVYHKDENVLNFLLIGQDRRSGEGRARSDAMIVMTFNKNSNEITLTSFMRDCYVQIPGYKPNKLNAAFQYGGYKLLCETLWLNFGVEIDGGVMVDFKGFENLIDLLGGVEIKLTEKESDFLKEKYGWQIEPGQQTLNGAEALAYSRIRHIDSDYRRAARQRKVILSLIDAYKSKPIPEMLTLLDDVLELVTVYDISKGEITGYVWDLFPMLSEAEFDTLRIPVDGTFDQGDVQVRPGLKNWFQYHIDFEANAEILHELFDKGRDD